MSQDNGTVQCATHGPQQETFVCQHIVKGLQDKKRVGFFWTAADPKNPRPDARCSEFEKRVAATGGEWVGEAGEQLGAKILCGACCDTKGRRVDRRFCSIRADNCGSLCRSALPKWAVEVLIIEGD